MYTVTSKFSRTLLLSFARSAQTYMFYVVLKNLCKVEVCSVPHCMLYRRS